MLFSRGFGSKRLLCGRFHAQISELSHHNTHISLLNRNSNNIIHVRHKSGSRRRRSRRGEVIELQVDADSGELEAIALKHLEETIHKLTVKRAAPVWLPFRPGMSYYVPPPLKLDKVIELAISGGKINEDDLQAFATARRGWPSSAFYIGDDSSHIVEISPEKSEKSEEEEGWMLICSAHWLWIRSFLWESFWVYPSYLHHRVCLNLRLKFFLQCLHIIIFSLVNGCWLKSMT